MATPNDQPLIEEIGQRIDWYSTALMRIDSQVVNPRTDVFIGSGTFVQVDGQFGILTAHHVAAQLAWVAIARRLAFQRHVDKEGSAGAWEGLPLNQFADCSRGMQCSTTE
jgi:hypothetical protein